MYSLQAVSLWPQRRFACWGAPQTRFCMMVSCSICSFVFDNNEQASRTLCVRSRGLGCCPTSRIVDLAIHMHCLPRRLAPIREEVYPTFSDKPILRLFRHLHHLLRQSPSLPFHCHCTAFALTVGTCTGGYRTSTSLRHIPMTLADALLQSLSAALQKLAPIAP